MNKQVGAIPRNFIISGCIFLLMAYSVWANSPVPNNNMAPSDFFWKLFGASCTLLIFIVSYQIRRRDKLLDKIATAIFGDEDGKGLITQLKMMKLRFDSCSHCSPTPFPHMRADEDEPHYNMRVTDLDPTLALKQAVDNLRRVIHAIDEKKQPEDPS